MELTTLCESLRLNPAQTMEVETNFISDEITKLINNTDDISLKEWYMQNYLNDINSIQQGDKWRAWYDTLKDYEKESFFEGLKDGTNKISVEQPPMYGNTSIDDLALVYEKYNIKPVTLYVKKWGKMKKIPTDYVVGDKYIIKLKHHYILVVYKPF